jgi:DNA-binding CsgD family transcriptional regulator
MMPAQNGADDPRRPGWVQSGDERTSDLEIRHSSLERTRAAHEVGAAIAHQLNGPLTALRLYIGEIRQNSDRLRETADTHDRMQQMVDGAFREIERVCNMVGQIGDKFEQPLYPETAATLGREVITWWSRSGGMEGKGAANGREVAPLDRLTAREHEVLSHICRGCSNKQGAALMQIAARTFECHRARIMRKTGAKNGADLVRIAIGDVR